MAARSVAIATVRETNATATASIDVSQKTIINRMRAAQLTESGRKANSES